MRTYAVIGLGYVGLGLASALSEKNRVLGYDINPQRVDELRQNLDSNQQINASDLSGSNLTITSKLEDIKTANFYIVCVSTPAFFYETPNLKPLTLATQSLAQVIKKGDIIVFESTVYPGTTIDICIPILEQYSHLRCGHDFNVGFSPERINPGDKVNTLKNVTKIISAQNEATLAAIRQTYETICDTVYPVSSIGVAEAIKILENMQRDVNIAVMNEFTKIMHALDLNTHEIIEGAKTKWDFVPYKPGFVGGHCISIDPHYLAFVGKRCGIQPELILAARHVNDGMTQFVIDALMKLIVKHKLDTSDLTIGVFGIAYKENVPDIRNSLSLKLIKELHLYGLKCCIHDPLVSKTEQEKHNIKLEDFDQIHDLSVAIIVVSHDFYQHKLPDILHKCKNPKVVIDIPNIFIDDHPQYKDIVYWNL